MEDEHTASGTLDNIVERLKRLEDHAKEAEKEDLNTKMEIRYYSGFIMILLSCLIGTNNVASWYIGFFAWMCGFFAMVSSLFDYTCSVFVNFRGKQD